jgi:TolA-binding protein
MLLFGCAASLGGSSSGLQRDVDSLRVAVDRLRQEQAADRARLDALSQESADAESQDVILQVRDRLDVIEAQVYALAHRLEGGDEQIGALTYELQRLRFQVEEARALARTPTSPEVSAQTEAGGEEAPLDAASAPAGGPSTSTVEIPPAPVPPAEDPAGVFQRAYADYTRGDYELATLGFDSVIRLRPEGALADDAVYYLAEISSAQGRVDDALAGYARVEEEFPDGDKVPAAILKRGLLLLEANRIGEGVVQLDHLAKSYPETDEARLARNKLRALGVGP